MRVSDYAAAIEASDEAIGAMLIPGLGVAGFLRRVLTGVHAQQLLRVNVAQIPFDRTLREPFTLRWEALRRSGRVEEAAEMRAVCVRLWPERASVWATAGSHALDEGNAEQALHYFERCLERAPASVAGLAGRAIVYELRKDWPRALQARAAVVEVSDALGRSDAPSLHRTIRYGVALARAGRLAEAGRELRRCVRLGAFDKLPIERFVLLRFFGRELYAPAMIAKMRPGAAEPELARALRLALAEAHALQTACQVIQADGQLSDDRRELLLGVCAWEAGDPERAFGHFDVADAELAADVPTHYLLMMSALATGSTELASIERYAREAAQRCLAAAAEGIEMAEVDRLYAALTLAGSAGDTEAVLTECARLQGQSPTWIAHSDRAEPGLPSPAMLSEGPLDARLLRWSAWREVHRRLGHSAAAVAHAAPASLLQPEP